MLIRLWLAACAMAFALGSVAPATAQQTEARIALVIGNAAYQAGELKTPANDAGLVAQTLQAAGFDVVGARDLDQDSLRRAFRDFLQKAQSSGPNTVAFVYLGGYGLQLEGENYFVPIDARIARDTDIPVEALRLSDYTRPLAALRLKASIFVLDAARPHPFTAAGQPLAGGLALTEAEPGMLIAFNAMPGTVAPESPDAYGAYARALAEMLREGGLPLPAVFDRVRLRVNEMTQGAEIPWHASKVQANVAFFERAPDAPPPAVSADQMMAMRTRPIREFGAQEAYLAALDRDSMQGYLDFLAAYPDDPMARRVRAIVAARREAITWRRTRVVDTAQAYWSYLRRYPNGPHAYDARRRLAFHSFALEPPANFAMVEYEVAPPQQDEVAYIDRPVLAFSDPGYGFAPPPPAPVYFLPPQPAEFVVVPPPPAPIGLFLLPTPIYRPVPAYVRPPAYVAPPPANNVIYNNVHNTVVINNTTNTVTVTNPAGQTSTVTPTVAVPPTAGVGAAAIGASAPGAGGRPQPAAPVPAVASVGPALPPSVQQKANTIQQQGGPRGPGAPGAAPGQPGGGQPLPGVGARPPVPPPSAALPPGTAQPVRPGAIPTPVPGVSPGTIAPPPGAGRQPPPPGTGQPPTAPGVAARPPQPGTTPPTANVAPGATPPAGQPGSPQQTQRPGIPPPAVASRPPAGGSPPGVAPRPPGSPPPNVNRPPLPPAVARPTPPNAPPTATPPANRPPPPPAVANRPPPSAPPPPAVRQPPPPPPAAARPAPPPQVVNRPPPAAAPPPPRPAAPPPPPPPRVAAPPPPKPAAPPPAAKPPQCPPGKSFQNGACK